MNVPPPRPASTAAAPHKIRNRLGTGRCRLARHRTRDATTALFCGEDTVTCITRPGSKLDAGPEDVKRYGEQMGCTHTLPDARRENRDLGGQ